MFTPDGRTDNGIQKYLVSKDVVIEMRYIIIQHRTAHHLTWLTLRHLDQLGPVLELSTLGCSSTYNKTLQV